MTSTVLRRLRSRRARVAGLAGLVVLGLVTPGAPAFGADDDAPGAPSGDLVQPTVVGDNPSCRDLGYGFGRKVEGSPNGTFIIDSVNNTVTISNSNGVTFDWSATLGIDAVIVKGGNNSNVFAYTPEDTADTVLHAPLNTGNDTYYGLSHIEFCYDYELSATKTANAEYVRTYTWIIDKRVDDDSHTGWAGDSFTSNYTVAVDRTVNDTDFAVEGTITVSNPTPHTVSFGVSDSVGGTAAAVNCSGVTSLAPGASTVCTYSASLGSKTNGTNVATVTSNTAGVGGTTASAPYTFGDPTTVVGPPTVNVTDTFEGLLGSASDDKSFPPYDRAFTCPTNAALYTDGVYTEEFPNTARITETGQSDDENVTLTCYRPGISKTAVGAYDRDWTWTITKDVDPTSLLLSEGQTYLVDYEVVVDGTSADSEFAVSGTITVHLPGAPIALVATIADVLSDGTVATLSGCSAPLAGAVLTIPAGATAVTCNYTASPANAGAANNTATITLPSGQAISATQPIMWGVTETDECVDVTDTLAGVLGEVCGDESGTFTYSLNFGPAGGEDVDVALVCGENTVENVATATANDTGTEVTDNATVIANVSCEVGCTLTPGYWKTHSLYGPAPYDDTWALLVGGANRPFFLSGKTYYQALWTPPAGNAYYILAHAYIAAELNLLNGASIPASVQTAFNSATSLLTTKTPAQVAGLKGAAKSTWVNLAKVLDDYNNGLTGPGHCSE